MPPDVGSARGPGPRFWRFWAANAVSNLGDGVSLVAIPWLASTLTRDPILISAITVATRIPWLLIALPTGVLVDRLDRRRLMAAAASARAGLSAVIVGLVVTDTMTIWLLVALALLLGTCEVVYDLTAGALLPSLVPESALERANGWLFGAQMTVNELAGPPVGGALLGLALALPFVVNVGSFGVAAALALLLLREVPRPRAPEPRTAPRGPVLREAISALAFVWRRPVLRTLALSQALLNAAVTMTLATYVLFAREVLGLDETGLGLLLASGAVGAVLGSVLGPRTIALVGRSPILRLMFLVGAAGNVVIATAGTWPVAAAAHLVLSFSGMTWNVLVVSLQQRSVTSDQVGRVLGVGRWMSWGLMSVGAASGGLVVAAISEWGGRDLALRSPFVVAAVVFGVVGVLTFRHLGPAPLRSAERERPTEGVTRPIGAPGGSS